MSVLEETPMEEAMLEANEHGMSRDFGEFIAERDAARIVSRIAPPRTEPLLRAVERSGDLRDMDDESYDPTRPEAFEDALFDEVTRSHMDWAADEGSRFVRRAIEGAAFARIAEDAFLIPVTGAQPLHHDRHIADLDDGGGFSEHTWNLVVQGSASQLLLCENGHGVFEHFPMDKGVLVYMNTINRHALSRRDPTDVCIILQVCGYGPDQRDAAVARMAAICAAEPKAVRL